jgi:hypothetical protein
MIIKGEQNPENNKTGEQKPPIAPTFLLLLISNRRQPLGFRGGKSGESAEKQITTVLKGVEQVPENGGEGRVIVAQTKKRGDGLMSLARPRMRPTMCSTRAPNMNSALQKLFLRIQIE